MKPAKNSILEKRRKLEIIDKKTESTLKKRNNIFIL
jgi:hypothetical protein